MTIGALNQVLLLGQSARIARAQNDVWLYLIVLVVGALVIVVIGLIARKVFADPIESSEGEAVFDLSELRRLHRAGQLTDDEYEAAKAAVLMDGASFLAQAPAAAERPARPGGLRPADDPGVELGPELLGPSPTPPNGDEADNPDADASGGENRPGS
jgi:hypothetical protein